MNTLLTWYRHTIWMGIVLNLGLLLQNGSPTNKQVSVQGIEKYLLTINDEAEHTLPVELVRRQIGYRSVEPTCTFCHDGAFKGRNLSTNRPKVLTYSPTQMSGLEASQRSSYDCAASKRSGSDTLMRYIDPLPDRSSTGHMVYKHLTIPFAKTALLKQQQTYAWQK
ncbi:hypothetical protein [Spirosoma linguale]|uniref:Cytochrome c domain-containing protein n=1 Tax=Spirosoma linguale (strain ATCC 33905 / DSM 74 / LMG 10896 / Claus 1) TaxID=504472 RepID=D2QNP4_SPILD|nr:hypothetical protein Slin_4602 [Spirosoma linguale DSM 74]